jgi:hypothetical protein
MIEKLFRGYVEGLGSKTLAAIFAAIVSAVLAPILLSKFGVDPALTFDVLVGIGTLITLFLFRQWHLDASTGGKTSTQYLMTLKALQAAEVALPDGTTLDTIVKQVIKSMQDASATKGEPPPAPVVPSPASPQ